MREGAVERRSPASSRRQSRRRTVTVTAIADVSGVDAEEVAAITLKGPRGNVVTLDGRNPDQFKVVKKGGQVEVTYTEALALSVEPAPKPAAKMR